MWGEKERKKKKRNLQRRFEGERDSVVYLRLYDNKICIQKPVMENCPCCHQNTFVTQTTESAHADRTTGRKHVPGSGREVRGGQGEGS